MTSLVCKILLQALAVAIAMLVSILDYVVHDKKTSTFNTGRKWLFILSSCFLIASIVFTIIDNNDNDNKEKALKRQLDKVQLQNDRLQNAVSVLSDDQRERFISLLGEQEKVGNETSKQVRGSANLLRDRIENSIGILNRSANEINRAINPIREMTISCQLSTSLKNTPGDDYRLRVENAISELLKQPNGIEKMGMPYVSNGFIDRIGITKAPYIPDKEKELAVYLSIYNTFITIDFYKNSVSIPDLIANQSTPDLQMQVAGSADNSIPRRNPSYQIFGSSVSLMYELKNKNFVTHSYNLTPSLQRNMTGKITSIPDLSGSQMVICVGRSLFSAGSLKATSDVKDIFKSIKLRNMTLTMSEGREVIINGSDLHQYTDKNNYVFYVYKFPQKSRGVGP